jgi:hypothetical protein
MEATGTFGGIGGRMSKVLPSELRWISPEGKTDEVYPRSWDRLLLAGSHKIQEADNQTGPWTDAFMGDNGSIVVTKKWTRCRPKSFPETAGYDSPDGRKVKDFL